METKPVSAAMQEERIYHETNRVARAVLDVVGQSRKWPGVQDLFSRDEQKRIVREALALVLAADESFGG